MYSLRRWGWNVRDAQTSVDGEEVTLCSWGAYCSRREQKTVALLNGEIGV